MKGSKPNASKNHFLFFVIPPVHYDVFFLLLLNGASLRKEIFKDGVQSGSGCGSGFLFFRSA